MALADKASNDGARGAFDEAVGLLQDDAFEEASNQLEAALKVFPNDPNLLRLLGVALCRLSRFSEAEEKLTHVTRLVPDYALAYEYLAEALLPQGRIEEAVAALKSAVKHNPTSGQAAKKLQEILALIGRNKEADEVFAEALNHNRDRSALVEAMELNRQGEPAKAEKIYREILRRDPENVDALRLMGVLCVKAEKYNDAEAFFQRAVDIAPDYWRAWINLGMALNEQTKFDEADAAYKRALEVSPRSVPTLEKLGTNSLNAGRLGESIEWLQKALQLDQKHFPSLLCLGHALKTEGEQNKAVDAYRRCAESKPDFGEVYWSLANLKTFRFTDDEVAEMERQKEVLVGKEDGLDSEVSFAFALGKAFEDRKDYEQAFRFYAEGNEKKRPTVNHDPVDFQKMNDRIIDVFSAEFFAERKGQGCADDSPILIVGLPRSGSTLLEQILASHSQVDGTAELHYLLRGANEAGLNRIDGIRYPECMLELNAQQVADLGEEYLQHAAAHRGDGRFFTDKMPNNFTSIGFLHAILPNAKVIDARRHPLDSCLGTFKQLFARGQTFSYDLYDLAHYYEQYVRIMRHWDEVLPGKVLRVDYEDVVADLDGQTHRIAKHCELDWEEQMVRFHETKRPVKTASSEQVRQPIYKGSVNLWRNYEESLGELVDYLETVLLELPQDQIPEVLKNA